MASRNFNIVDGGLHVALARVDYGLALFSGLMEAGSEDWGSLGRWVGLASERR